MHTFSWDAVDRRGRARHGVRNANSGVELARALEKEGYVLVAFRADDSTATARHAIRRVPGPLVVEALRSVIALLRAGLPLEKALSSAADAADARCRPLLHGIRDAIKQGSSVSEGFARQPMCFDSTAVGLIRSGERSGDLAGAMEMLADLRDKEIQLRASVLTAAIYPAILTVTSVLAAAAVIILVVPRFAEMIADAGGELPATTALLLTISQGLRSIVPLLGVLVLVVLATGMTALKREPGGRWYDRLISRVPLIGPIRRSSRMARGARVAGNLTRAGIPLVDALVSAEEALGMSGEAMPFRVASAHLRDGMSPAEAFNHPDFPPVLSRLARAGSEAGEMGTFLLAAADALDRTVETTSRRLGIVLEPLVIVVFGGVIGFVAFALFQAVYSMNAGGFG